MFTSCVASISSSLLFPLILLCLHLHLPVSFSFSLYCCSVSFVLSSCPDRYAGISRLSKDYLNTTGIINKMPRLEGMAMFRLPNGTYYMAYVCVCVCVCVCDPPFEAYRSFIVSEALRASGKARETNKKECFHPLFLSQWQGARGE